MKNFKEPINKKNILGQHLILDLWEVPKKYLIFEEFIKDIHNLKEIIKRGLQVNILDFNYHEFPNGSFSLIFLLSESHISLHSWPEYDYMAVDAFTCSLQANLDESLTILTNYFETTNFEKTYLTRGENYK